MFCTNIKLWSGHSCIIRFHQVYEVYSMFRCKVVLWVMTTKLILVKDPVESPESDLKSPRFSKAKHIACTCWFHCGMQRASLSGNKHPL